MTTSALRALLLRAGHRTRRPMCPWVRRPGPCIMVHVQAEREG